MYQNIIKICNWNIREFFTQGENKHSDNIFLKEVKKTSLIILSENISLHGLIYVLVSKNVPYYKRF